MAPATKRTPSHLSSCACSVVAAAPSERNRCCGRVDSARKCSGILRRIGVAEADLKVVLNELKRDALVALVADGKTVRVVAGGIGKIESGLIFLGNARSPATGDRIGDGRRYVFVEPLERGIVYYETN